MNMTAALIAGSVLQQLALGFQFKVNPDSRALACHSIEQFKKAYPHSKGGLATPDPKSGCARLDGGLKLKGPKREAVIQIEGGTTRIELYGTENGEEWWLLHISVVKDEATK